MSSTTKQDGSAQPKRAESFAKLLADNVQGKISAKRLGPYPVMISELARGLRRHQSGVDRHPVSAALVDGVNAEPHLCGPALEALHLVHDRLVERLNDAWVEEHTIYSSQYELELKLRGAISGLWVAQRNFMGARDPLFVAAKVVEHLAEVVDEMAA